jgi:Secretion system C-terminal sorting domain
MKYIIIIFLLFSSITSSFCQKRIGFAKTKFITNEKQIYAPRCFQIDNDGNKFVAGIFKNYAYFDSTTIHTITNGTSNAIFLAKYNENNELIWAKKIAEDDSDTYYGNLGNFGMSLDKSGNIYFAISFKSKLFLENDTFISRGEGDALILKYDNNCSLLYTKQIGNFNDESISNLISITDKNELLITGSFNGTWTNDFPNYDLIIDNDTLHTNHRNLYYAKFDSLGNAILVKSFEGSGIRQKGGMQIIEYNNAIYLLGNTITHIDTIASLPISFPYTSQFNDKFFLVKMDSVGNGIWVKPFGIGGLNGGGGIQKMAIANNQIYIIGGGVSSLQTLFDLNGGPLLVGNSSPAYFIASYNATNGLFKWSKMSQSPCDESLSDLVIDKNGILHCIGDFSCQLSFGTDTLQSYGSADFFVVGYDSNGSLQYVTEGGGGSTENVNAIISDNNGKIHIAGGSVSSVLLFGNDTIFKPLIPVAFFISTLDSIPIITPLSVTNSSTNDTEFTIYPNPTSQQLFIQIPANITTKISITLTNAIGQIVYDKQWMPQQIINQKIEINTAAIPAGLYFVSITHKTQQTISKLSIQSH